MQRAITPPNEKTEDELSETKGKLPTVAEPNVLNAWDPTTMLDQVNNFDLGFLKFSTTPLSKEDFDVIMQPIKEKREAHVAKVSQTPEDNTCVVNTDNIKKETTTTIYSPTGSTLSSTVTLFDAKKQESPKLDVSTQEASSDNRPKF